MDNDAQVSTVGVFSGNGSSFANRIALARQVEDDVSGSRAPGDNLQWEALTADLELWADRIETLATPTREEVDRLSEMLVAAARRLERLA